MRKLHLGKLHRERGVTERIFQALPTQTNTRQTDTVAFIYKMFLEEGFILTLKELIILPASYIKVRYSSTSALRLHSLDENN